MDNSFTHWSLPVRGNHSFRAHWIRKQRFGHLLVVQTAGKERKEIIELITQWSLRTPFFLIAAGDWLPDHDDLRYSVFRYTNKVNEPLDNMSLVRARTCFQLLALLKDADQRATMSTSVGATTLATTTYGYDGLNRLTSVGTGPTQTTTYEYDPVGFLTDIHRPNDVDTVYTPNESNQVDLITHSNASGTRQTFDYLLDNAGNRKQVTEAGGSYINWDYDELYRLTDETRYPSVGAPSTMYAHFEYDAAGNRESMMVVSTTTNYTYNALDQLTSAGAVTYDYDDRGNLSEITDGSNITNYTYDAADRLTNVTAPGVSASYAYDADGRRVKQTLGSAVTNYLWDEASPYGDVVLDTNGSGSTLVSYVLDGTGLVSQTSVGTTSYYLQDGQGSTRALTNSDGNVTDTYSYTAFGEQFNQTGSTTNNYLYTGQQFDSLTGLYDLRARYYDPALGRFLSQDTYPYNFSNPVELNRYVYTANSPINAMDQSGHSLVEYLGTQIVKVGAAATTVYFFAPRAYTMLAYYVSKLAPYSANDFMNFVSIVQFADTRLRSSDGGGGGNDEDWGTEAEFWAGRNAYEAEVREIPARAYAKMAAGEFGTENAEHEAAKWAIAERRGLGIKYKDRTAPRILEEIYRPKPMEIGLGQLWNILQIAINHPQILLHHLVNLGAKTLSNG